MATATTRTTGSTKSAVNGASRQVKAISRRAASTSQNLQTKVMRESRAFAKRAGELISTATRTTRQHPWAALSFVAAGAALVGGYLWANRRPKSFLWPR